jgi:hypothetical protein
MDIKYEHEVSRQMRFDDVIVYRSVKWFQTYRYVYRKDEALKRQ